MVWREAAIHNSDTRWRLVKEEVVGRSVGRSFHFVFKTQCSWLQRSRTFDFPSIRRFRRSVATVGVAVVVVVVINPLGVPDGFSRW